MMTTFQTSGLMAGTAKWSYALSTPTTSPLSPRISTTGNSTWLSPTVRSSRRASKASPVKAGMTTPAIAMKSTEIAPRTARIRKNSVEASRNASLRRSCSSSSVKTGTKAALSAASANRLRTTLGTWKAMVNALNGPLVAK
jgi:hypothetical protein